MAVLLVCTTEGPTIAVDKPIILVGRHPDCDVQLESQKVSRRHCCVAQVHGEVVVRDLGSTNGIRLNGSVVQEARLAPGDELAIGNVRFRLEQDEDAALKNAANGARDRLTALRAGPDPVSSDVPILLSDESDIDDAAADVRTLEPDDDDRFPFAPPASGEINLAPSDHGSKGG
jgi:predicted component of type VI protein secretion system